MLDLNSINIEELSLEEINKLLPQVQVELEKAQQVEAQAKVEEAFEKKPINERVEYRFSETWGPILDTLTKEHLDLIQKEKDKFVLNEGMRIALERSIGSDYTALFFKTLKKCVKERNFRSNARFYKNVDDDNVKQVARVAFYIYRLNLCRDDDNPEELGLIKKKMGNLVKSDNPLVQSALKDLMEVGLFPA